MGRSYRFVCISSLWAFVCIKQKQGRAEGVNNILGPLNSAPS